MQHFRRNPIRSSLLLAFLLTLSLAGVALRLTAHDPPAPGTIFSGPTSSQPLALTANGRFMVVANPDNDTVSFFDVRNDLNVKLGETAVQREPNGVAFLPNGRKAFAANTISGTVSVISFNPDTGQPGSVRHIKVGTEPYALCLTPNGSKLYVLNARSNDLSVIDTEREFVRFTAQAGGNEPRGCAITNDGDADDGDEILYVTRFLSLPVPGKVDGQDDAKAGRLGVLRTSDSAVLGNITINPLADSGFKAAGDSLARIAPGANFIFPTGVYPNQFNNVTLKGKFALLPNTGASPNGPFRFNVNTQSLLSVVDQNTRLDAGKTINMHSAVDVQSNPAKLFLTVPWTMAVENSTNDGWVASAASNVMVKVRIDPNTGAPVVLNDPADPARVFEIKVGKNPRGVVVSPDDRRMYVANYVSRDVTVIDLTLPRENVLTTLASAALPAAGSQADKIHAGKELYNTSVGEFDGVAGNGRMANNGWGSCSACHPFGLSDNVVWIFPDGPRRTLPQHTDFDQTDPTRSILRALNWSAVRDEEEDFELNIRGVSGGKGLIVLGDGTTPDPAVFNLTPQASGSRNQVKLRGLNAWDAIKTYIQFGIRTPISPISPANQFALEGRQLFIQANCQKCHGGPQWTSGRIRFTPPPAAGLLKDGQILSELRQVGTFDPNFLNEVKNNGSPAAGVDGFVPPSLLGLHAFPETFLHNGVATSLERVLQNRAHRTAGNGADFLSDASGRERVIKFLLSIDANTPIINP